MARRKRITMEEWLSFGKEEVESFLKDKRYLQKLVAELYKRRERRPLTGEDSIELRTFGEKGRFNPEYYDKKKGKIEKTELAELLEAIRELERNPKEEEKILHALEEAGDILWQYVAAITFHRENPEFRRVTERFYFVYNLAISKIAEILKVPYEIAESGIEDVCKAKYGVRAWLESKGYEGKFKEGEKEAMKKALKGVYPLSTFLESQA